MAIDKNIRIEAQFCCRWMTVGAMKALLCGLEDDELLMPNCVGNLSIFEHEGRFLRGYVDFQVEELDLFRDEVIK